VSARRGSFLTIPDCFTSALVSTPRGSPYRPRFGVDTGKLIGSVQ
jgi:hypothetical protein